MSLTVLRSAADLQQWRKNQPGKVAFVPTMGNLHEGHLSLVRIATSMARATIVSIYVNPTQFQDANDFNAYPVTLEQDQKLLEDVNVSALFLPLTEELYPDGKSVLLDPPKIATPWEGEYRPGHFAGVCTVVKRLFQMVDPSVAVFGEKDFQQLQVIKTMCKQLCIEVEIVGGSTVRESDGLALSSRNGRLDEGSRRKAVMLYSSLRLIAQAAHSRRSTGEAIREEVRRLEVNGFTVDYLSLVEEMTLSPINALTDSSARVIVAATINGVRLIDNIEIAPENN